MTSTTAAEVEAGVSGTPAPAVLGISKSKAVVEVTARMVDVNTGEILASVTGHGESERKGLTTSGVGLLRLEGRRRPTRYGEHQLQPEHPWPGREAGRRRYGQEPGPACQSAFRSTLLLQQRRLTVWSPMLPAADIIINVGSSAGVRVGDKLAVTRVVRTVKDPATGKVLRTIDSPVGMLTDYQRGQRLRRRKVRWRWNSEGRRCGEAPTVSGCFSAVVEGRK